MKILEAQFKQGDIVELKSGSDLMTVQSINGDSIECVWFDQKRKLQTNVFKAGMLEKAESGGDGEGISFQPV